MITYPSEMLPAPDEGDDAEVIVQVDPTKPNEFVTYALFRDGKLVFETRPVSPARFARRNRRE